MCDDQSQMSPLLSSSTIKILFVVFMVLSNWTLLAILTSVVTDNMMKATLSSSKKDREEEQDDKRRRSIRRLKQLFTEVDFDGSKTIDANEFKALLEDRALSMELCDASSLKVSDLADLFVFLSHEDEDGRLCIDIDMFVDKLQNEGKEVSERSVFRVEKQVRVLGCHFERRISERFDQLLDVIQKTKCRSCGVPIAQEVWSGSNGAT